MTNDLRERLIQTASWDALGNDLAVSVDTAVAVVAAWLREAADGWASRSNYEISMRRSRGGMRLRTAALALYGLADSVSPPTEEPT